MVDGGSTTKARGEFDEEGSDRCRAGRGGAAARYSTGEAQTGTTEASYPSRNRVADMMPGPYHEYSRQQAAERVGKAYQEGLAKQTRHARIGTTKRAVMVVGAVMAWVGRLVGGGGA
jgi:hypothetical protein